MCSDLDDLLRGALGVKMVTLGKLPRLFFVSVANVKETVNTRTVCPEWVFLRIGIFQLTEEACEQRNRERGVQRAGNTRERGRREASIAKPPFYISLLCGSDAGRWSCD